MNQELVDKITTLLIQQRNDLAKSSNQDCEVDASGDEVDKIQAKIIADISEKLSVRNKNKFDQITNAFVKLKDGTFGLCEDCGDEIADKRLLANPWFTTCISCAEQREMDAKQK